MIAPQKPTEYLEDENGANHFNIQPVNAEFGADSGANPCTACGASCAYYRVSFYCGEVSGGSGARVPLELVSQVSDVLVCMKGTENGHGRCVALVGQLGQSGVHCSIYAQRPSTCREFQNWRPDGTPNPECQRLRAMIGLPALLARPPSHSISA